MVQNSISLEKFDSKMLIPVANPVVDEAIGAFARYLMKRKIAHESVATVE